MFDIDDGQATHKEIRATSFIITVSDKYDRTTRKAYLVEVVNERVVQSRNSATHLEQ